MPALPPIELTNGLNAEEREEFKRAWSNAKWFTDPAKRSLERRLDMLIDDLINGDDTARGEIKALQKLINLFP